MQWASGWTVPSVWRTNQLSYAARVVAAIARFAKTDLTPQVVDLQSAATGTSGALIVANSNAINQTSLNPPVSGDGSIVNFALPTELKVNIDNGLGSIQAFADPPRNRSVVLVTTTKDWALVDPIFSNFEGSAGDWSQLKGDVLVAGAEGAPTNVAIRPTGNVFEPGSTASRWWHYGSIVGGVLAAIAASAVLAVAVSLYLRRRNARLTQKLVSAHSIDDSHDDEARPS